MPIYLDALEICDKMTDEMILELNSMIEEHDMNVLSFFTKEKKFLGFCVCDKKDVKKLKKKHTKEGVDVCIGNEVIRPVKIARN